MRKSRKEKHEKQKECNKIIITAESINVISHDLKVFR